MRSKRPLVSSSMRSRSVSSGRSSPAITPGNVASRRLLERLGFVYTHEEFYAPTGLEHPSYLFARPANESEPYPNARL
jgi:hypothetical protein